MYSYLYPRKGFLQAETHIYNTPVLLSSVIEKLEELAEKHNFDRKIPRRAAPGCVVDLLDFKEQHLISVELVMPKDASPGHGRISVLSPLGSSLLGLERGDVSRVNLFGRTHKFQILNIQYSDTLKTRKEESPS